MKMGQTECSETSAYKIQMPVNYPKKAYNKKLQFQKLQNAEHFLDQKVHFINN